VAQVIHEDDDTDSGMRGITTPTVVPTPFDSGRRRSVIKENQLEAEAGFMPESFSPQKRVQLADQGTAFKLAMGDNADNQRLSAPVKPNDKKLTAPLKPKARKKSPLAPMKA